MTTFNEREKAFEEKFKYDEELRFKIHARRNKLLGVWAGIKMGLTAAGAEAYAQTVVAADFEKPGDEDVLAKVLGDLTAKEILITAAEIRHEMERLLLAAKEEIERT